MSGLGQTLGRWNAHTYQSAAAVLSAGLNDGALWIINSGGMPVEAGIWPQVPGGGGATVYATAAARDAAGVVGEGDWCFVADIQSYQRFVTYRDVGVSSFNINSWVPAQAYNDGGADPDAGDTLQFLHNGVDPVLWMPPNSLVGNDLVAALPIRGWADVSAIGGALSDVGGDSQFDSNLTAWGYASMVFTPVVNMPTNLPLDPGRIYVQWSVDVVAPPPTNQQGHRGFYAGVYDGTISYCMSNSYNAVANNMNFCSIGSNGNALTWPGATQPMINTPYNTVWAMSRPGTWTYPAGAPAPASGNSLFEARIRDEFYNGQNNAGGHLYPNADPNPAITPQIVLVTGANSVSSNVRARLRSFFACRMYP